MDSPHFDTLANFQYSATSENVCAIHVDQVAYIVSRNVLLFPRRNFRRQNTFNNDKMLTDCFPLLLLLLAV